MKMPFDKVFVLSLPSFKSRCKFMKAQLDNLGISFNFNWGIDLGNINKDSLDYKIQYPCIFGDHHIHLSKKCLGTDISCSLNHYSAVYKAYEFGCNSILIFEDDLCFIKDKNLIEQSLNNIPKDADFVTWDPRFGIPEDINQFSKDLDLNQQKLYIKDNGQYKFMYGGMMYAIMNRKTMKLYLDNQRKKFCAADHIHGLFRNISVNKYISTKCLCTDQLNIENNFNVDNILKLSPHMIGYICQYKNLNINNFYIPKIFSKKSERLNV